MLRLSEALEERFNDAIFPLPSNAQEVIHDEIVSLVASTFKGDDPESGQLHLDFEPYDFSYIPIETLSSIYEQFLHTQGTGKKMGAIYTPEPVADYLLCELANSKPLKKGMKILDPCCGSGIFLVLAYRRLIELELAKSPQEKLKPTELRQILVESLYGVERNRDACYVAEFSLILTLLNYIEPPDLHRNKQFKFPRLHNTQIFECDFFDDDSDFWKQNKQFDWIVGNPPWIELKTSTEGEELARSWIKQNHQQRPATGNRVCEAFSWRVIDLLAAEGYVGLLIHAKSLFNHESKKYRQAFFKQHEVARVTNFSNLVYVLFGGRVKARAATIVYRKAIPNNEKPYIVHYGPFVANQVSNRPWRRNEKIPTWMITINESEIQTIASEEAETGESLIWKLALWGNYRDKKTLRRIKRLFASNLDTISQAKGWSLSQGLELKEISVLDNNNKVEYADYLRNKKYFDVNAMNKAGYHFAIPRGVLKPIQSKKCFIRKRGGKIGLNIIQAPHLVFNRNFFIYSDEDFILTAPHIGLSVQEEDSDILRALAVFLSSSIVKYYLFFQSPSWGVDRNRIYLKDVKKIPVCNFSGNQVRELAFLQRQLVDLEINYSKPKELLQEQLDKEIQRILNIPQNLNIIAKEFINLRLQLNKGKTIVPATELPNQEHLYNYGLCLRDELDDFTEGSGMKHKVSLVYSKDLIVCCLEFIHSDNSLEVSVEAAKGNTLSFLSQVQKKLRQRFSQWVYVQRGLRIFENSKISICKAPRLIDWTRTQALNDSDDIIAEILSAKRQIVEVDQ